MRDFGGKRSSTRSVPDTAPALLFDDEPRDRHAGLESGHLQLVHDQRRSRLRHAEIMSRLSARSPNGACVYVARRVVEPAMLPRSQRPRVIPMCGVEHCAPCRSCGRCCTPDQADVILPSLAPAVGHIMPTAPDRLELRGLAIGSDAGAQSWGPCDRRGEERSSYQHHCNDAWFPCPVVASSSTGGRAMRRVEVCGRG